MSHSNEVQSHYNMEQESRKKVEVEITLLSSAFLPGSPAITSLHKEGVGKVIFRGPRISRTQPPPPSLSVNYLGAPQR